MAVENIEDSFDKTVVNPVCISYICRGVIFLKGIRFFIGILSICFITISIFLWGNQTPIRPTDGYIRTLPIIIVDAGHGGIDGGTSGADGTVEKHINLSIAEKVKEILVNLGFRVVMTRTEDTLIGNNRANTIREQKRTDLQNRLSLTEKYDNCVLLSIHQNYFEDAKYSGCQVFYSANHDDSKLLAEKIQKDVVRNLQPDNTRAVKKCSDDIYLLYNCQKTAVMVECGFMSNPRELTMLKDENYQTKFAFSIALSLLSFYTE